MRGGLWRVGERGVWRVGEGVNGEWVRGVWRVVVGVYGELGE